MKMEMDIMAPDDDAPEKNVLADLVSGLRDGTEMLRAPQHDRDSDLDIRAHRRRTQFIDLR